MQKKWAAEPWKIVEGQCFIKSEEGWGSILDAQDWFIAKLEDSLDPEANAERIVACVNALRNLDPAGVPAVVEALEGCLEALARVRGADAQAAEALERGRGALARLGRAPGAGGR